MMIWLSYRPWLTEEQIFFHSLAWPDIRVAYTLGELARMADITMAIDPGTHKTGVAIFQGEALAWATLIEAPRGMEVEARIEFILGRLEQIEKRLPGRIGAVALEQATAIEGRQPAPELQTLIRRLQRWAKGKPRRTACHTYHPSTIHSRIRFRQHSGPRKEQIKLGVLALYSRNLPNDPPEDVIDAVAIGHCHMAQIQKDRILAASKEGR